VHYEVADATKPEDVERVVAVAKVGRPQTPLGAYMAEPGGGGDAIA
jgi:hypothetical protein